MQTLGINSLHLVHQQNHAVEEREVTRTAVATLAQLLYRAGVGYGVEVWVGI